MTPTPNPSAREGDYFVLPRGFFKSARNDTHPQPPSAMEGIILDCKKSVAFV
ncbi:hypothetical protein [Helicobacter sp. T3_23-1059]